MRRLKTRLRAEEGMTLIELLIAMTIMSVGIAALVAGFSTGIVSIQRANVTSTAGTLADKQMETFRQASYATVQSKPERADRRPGWSQVLDTERRFPVLGFGGTTCQLLRDPCKPSRQARDDQVRDG